MRVALISPLFESVPPRFYGGTERVVYNLCRGLTEANVEVTLFASGDSSVEGRVVPVIDEALRLRKDPVSDPFAYNFKMLSLVSHRAREFDLIHNHHDYWMLPLSEMCGVPFVTTLHGRLDDPDLKQALGAFPKVPFISISDSQRLGHPGLNWVKTIHHGIDVEDFSFHPFPGKYLAFLGRISPEKRPDLAVQIAKEAAIPLKIAAKIEGKPAKDYYDAFVKPHIDGKFIEYVGEISEGEKSDFLGNALALVFPIDWPEPFGLVMLESLACGTPILARPFGSVPELLAEGVTGFTHSDPKKLAERAKDLPSLDRVRCRAWVEEKFSLRRMTEEYIHVYKNVAESSVARVRTGAPFEPDRHRRNFLHSV